VMRAIEFNISMDNDFIHPRPAVARIRFDCCSADREVAHKLFSLAHQGSPTFLCVGHRDEPRFLLRLARLAADVVDNREVGLWMVRFSACPLGLFSDC
jgi:hypothetical protein